LRHRIVVPPISFLFAQPGTFRSVAQDLNINTWNIARNGSHYAALPFCEVGRVTEESRMRHANYTNDRWFMRTARTLPVVAMAALTGGAIGGFSVYAIILALTESPGTGAVALKTEAIPTADSQPQNAVSPIRTIGTPPPNVTEPPATLPAQPQQQAQAAPVPQQTPTSQNPTPQTPWPDALSRAHPTQPQAGATAEIPPPVSAPPAASETVNAAPSNNAAQLKPVPVKPSPQKRRVVSRKPLPAPNQTNGATASRSQPVYDYYDNNNYNRYGDSSGDNRYGDAEPAPRGPNAPPLDLSRTGRHVTVIDSSRTRIVVQRPLPPQPAPPGLFGGFFGGGGDRDDWR
jgi:hypothetical protein